MLRLCGFLKRNVLSSYKNSIQETVCYLRKGKGLSKRCLSQKGMYDASIRGPAGSIKKDESEKITPLGWFLLMIPITTFGLGCWQVKRKLWKEQLIKDLKHLTGIPPVDLPEDLDTLKDMEYRAVRVRGTFLHDKELIMGPRSFVRPGGAETPGGLFSQRDAGNGYWVITPFQLADRDDIILINRGWIPRKYLKPGSRESGQIKGELELTGVVRKGEQRPQFTPEHKGDVFLYRDLPRMCQVTGAQPILLDASYETTVPGGPVGGQTRITLHNDHLSYLITWYSLSLATSYLWYRVIIKRKPF
uniref:SURF1-like protein n=1 Tax=Glossina austeni TaxID=7395 RepID=A0A1A9UXX9_GLOAU